VFKKAAGEVSPPSRSLTSPAKPRRSVCAPVRWSFHCIADLILKGDATMRFFSWLRNGTSNAIALNNASTNGDDVFP